MAGTLGECSHLGGPARARPSWPAPESLQDAAAPGRLGNAEEGSVPLGPAPKPLASDLAGARALATGTAASGEPRGAQTLRGRVLPAARLWGCTHAVVLSEKMGRELGRGGSHGWALCVSRGLAPRAATSRSHEGREEAGRKPGESLPCRRLHGTEAWGSPARAREVGATVSRPPSTRLSAFGAVIWLTDSSPAANCTKRKWTPEGHDVSGHWVPALSREGGPRARHGSPGGRGKPGKSLRTGRRRPERSLATPTPASHVHITAPNG